jgi:hypothetical protein
MCHRHLILSQKQEKMKVYRNICLVPDSFLIWQNTMNTYHLDINLIFCLKKQQQWNAENGSRLNMFTNDKDDFTNNSKEFCYSMKLVMFIC